jgi:hypothetical protein
MPVEGGAAGEGERECTLFITTLEQLATQENEKEGLSFLSARKPVFALLWNQE